MSKGCQGNRTKDAGWQTGKCSTVCVCSHNTFRWSIWVLTSCSGAPGPRMLTRVSPIRDPAEGPAAYSLCLPATQDLACQVTTCPWGQIPEDRNWGGVPRRMWGSIREALGIMVPIYRGPAMCQALHSHDSHSLLFLSRERRKTGSSEKLRNFSQGCTARMNGRGLNSALSATKK